jgi:hypothetical protein
MCVMVKNCLNTGTFNSKTCACDCINSAYFGDQCQFSNCNNQPSVCLSISSVLCSDDIISTYCPLKCNHVICKCGFDSCLNGGLFSLFTCSCSCPTQFRGIRCETLISTTTTTTVKRLCAQQLQCMNGGKQSDITCACECNV